jgi:hypothetical protein
MIIATHQPIFLPWPGFFYKAAKSDALVLLDDVQFPRGWGWVNRNRVKGDQGELLLTVPVRKKDRGLQVVRHVEISGATNWRTKHLRSLQQNYVHAPYAREWLPEVEAVYGRPHRLLVDLNLDLIGLLWRALALPGAPLLQSELGVTGTGTDLLLAVCRRLGADRLLAFPVALKYLDAARLRAEGVELVVANFHPPVYPQLWGEFIYNLSALDLLLNCGPRSAETAGMLESRP